VGGTTGTSGPDNAWSQKVAVSRKVPGNKREKAGLIRERGRLLLTEKKENGTVLVCDILGTKDKGRKKKKNMSHHYYEGANAAGEGGGDIGGTDKTTVPAEGVQRTAIGRGRPQGRGKGRVAAKKEHRKSP